MTPSEHFHTTKNSRSLKNLIITAIAGLSFLASCTTKPAVVEASETDREETLTAGKTIYENSCARCHELPNPTAHSAQDWVGIMNWMAPKAKLNDEQHALVYDYIVSVKE